MNEQENFQRAYDFHTMHIEGDRVPEQHAFALVNRGLVLAEVKRYEEALRDFEAAITTEGAEGVHGLAHKCRGWALGQLGRVDEAIAEYELKDPADYLGYHHLSGLRCHAIYLSARSRVEEEIECYDEMLAHPEISDGFRIWVFYNKYDALIKRDRYEEALTCIDQLLTIPELEGLERGEAMMLKMHPFRALNRKGDAEDNLEAILKVPGLPRAFRKEVREELGY